MSETLKQRLATAIVTKLREIPLIKSVEFDRVRLRADDFMSVDCPAIQIIDIGESVQHEHSRAKKTWTLALEVVLKATSDAPVSQVDLWSAQYAVERQLWSIPNLAIPGVIHLRYLGSQTDLHLLEPYYFVRMDLECLFYEPLVRDI